MKQALAAKTGLKSVLRSLGVEASCGITRT